MNQEPVDSRICNLHMRLSQSILAGKPKANANAADVESIITELEELVRKRPHQARPCVIKLNLLPMAMIFTQQDYPHRNVAIAALNLFRAVVGRIYYDTNTSNDYANHIVHARLLATVPPIPGFGGFRLFFTGVGMGWAHVSAWSIRDQAPVGCLQCSACGNTQRHYVFTGRVVGPEQKAVRGLWNAIMTSPAIIQAWLGALMPWD